MTLAPARLSLCCFASRISTGKHRTSNAYGAKSTLWDRMFHFYMQHREEFLGHYHQRSNVETTFHMIKSKFGQRLRSKTMTAQINEALCKSSLP
jgi:transposase